MNIASEGDQPKENSAAHEAEYISPHHSLFTSHFATLLVKLAPVLPNYRLPLILSNDKDAHLQNLARTPNVLVAGTIGSGKTQFIYNQLAAWFYFKKPEELQVIICASKSIDYACFSKLKNHFIASGTIENTIGMPVEFQTIINGVIFELELRTQLLLDAGVRDVQQYNQLFKEGKLDANGGHKLLPDIVMVIDDLFNFLINDYITSNLVLLTQKFSHCGFFVIAVTSQINSSVISKQLKSNFTFRIALKLMSQSDSRKILDIEGAEKLISPEELMCYLNGQLIKTHQPYIDYEDLQNVIDFVSQHNGRIRTFFLEEDKPEEALFNTKDRDQFFEEAARLVVMHQQGSTSFIQRKLKLGYNRVGRIMDQLEAACIVGPFEGSKAREVLFPDEYSLEQYLSDLHNPDPSRSKAVLPKIEPIVKPADLPVAIESIEEKPQRNPGFLSSFLNFFR